MGFGFKGNPAILARPPGCGCVGPGVPGWSSLALLDPGLMSAIPAGMEMPRPGGMNPAVRWREWPDFPKCCAWSAVGWNILVRCGGGRYGAGHGSLTRTGCYGDPHCDV